MKQILPFILLICSQTSFAEVISSADNGFSIVISKDVPVSSHKTYIQFINVNKWWNKDHTWFGNSDNLHIEAKAGGCFCERDSDKQAFHMLVTFVDPDNEIRMVGGLGPLQMMGLNGGMSWKFESTNNDATTITLSYNVSGYSQQGLKSLATVVNNVLQLQVDALANSLSIN